MSGSVASAECKVISYYTQLLHTAQLRDGSSTVSQMDIDVGVVGVYVPMNMGRHVLCV
jgi:hypothetical protein